MSTVIQFVLLILGILFSYFLYYTIDMKLKISEKLYKKLPMADNTKASMLFGIWIVITIIVANILKTTFAVSPYVTKFFTGFCIGITAVKTVNMKQVVERNK